MLVLNSTSRHLKKQIRKDEIALGNIPYFEPCLMWQVSANGVMKSGSHKLPTTYMFIWSWRMIKMAEFGVVNFNWIWINYNARGIIIALLSLMGISATIHTLAIIG